METEEFTLNISTSRPPRKAVGLAKEDPAIDTNIAVEIVQKEKKLVPRQNQKSSSLFTKIPEYSIPETLKNSSKNDFSITNAPSSNEFQSMNLPEFLKSSLSKQSFQHATDIQQKVIPHLLQAKNTKDTIIQAQTGSGKTLAFVLPILSDLISLKIGDRAECGTLALIVVPTRELAQQVYDTFYSILYPKSAFKILSKDDSAGLEDENDDDIKGEVADRGKSANCMFRWIVPGILCGGQSKKSEKARLRKGISILVATPGRLLDHLESTKCLNLSQLRWMVFDEADRFEEMGMKESVTRLQNEVVARCSRTGNHKTILCSATVRAGIKELGGVILNDPVFLSCSKPQKVVNNKSKMTNIDENDSEDEMEMLPNQVRVSFVTVPAKLRLVTLAALLKHIQSSSENNFKTIVFFSNCATVDFYHLLFKDQFKVSKLHGSIDHLKRMETLKHFKSGVLLTTDLAARGLDFPGVKDIIQFDIPNDSMACVHRIGRTARCGNDGNAYIFVMPHEIGWIDHMAPIVSGQVLSYETIHSNLEKDLKVSDIRLELSKWQKDYEETSQKNQKMAKEAYMSSVKAYATHPRDIRKLLGIKKLHLGHFAKSFALRDAPSKLISRTTKKREKKEAADEKPFKKFKLEVPNEFASF